MRLDIFKVKHNLHLHTELLKVTEAIIRAQRGETKTHWPVQILAILACPFPAKRATLSSGDKYK